LELNILLTERSLLKKPVNINKNQLHTIKYLILVGVSAIIMTKVYLMLFSYDLFLGTYSFLTSFLVLSAFIFSYTKYKDPSNTKTHNSNGIPKSRQPLVSVIIPSKNDPVMIRKAVLSCLASSYSQIEVILVNDGSTDQTGEIMDLLRKEYPRQVKVVQLSCNVGKRKATREGIVNGCASGEIIILVDSDCELHNQAIEKLVSAFDNPEVGAVSGLGRGYNANENMLTKMQDTWYDGQFSIMKGMESAFGTVTCCPGILSAYRKEAIMPCLDAWANDKFLGSEFTFGDDRHLTSYVLGGNKHYLGNDYKVWKTVYCESAIVYTVMPPKLKKFIRQQIRWKKSWFRVFFFSVPFYYKDRNSFAAAFYYLQMIWSFLSPVVATRSLVYLPLQGHFIDALVYLSGLTFVGLLFAANFKMRNPNSENMWAYRLLWSWMGFFFSSLEYYSLLTIRDKSWLTR
jgi:hyaluronan synthase